MTLNFFEFHRSMDGVEDLYYHEIGQYGLKYAYLEEEVYAVRKEDTEYPKMVYADNPYLAWEFLEHKGFAKHVKNTTYRITDKGIQYLEDLFDIQILVERRLMSEKKEQ